MTRSRYTLGTHNLHDQAGTPTAFADVIMFTEAVPARIRLRLRLTHRVFVCKAQRDLVIAVRRGLLTRRVVRRFELCHPGEGGFTPHRGTFWLESQIAATGQDLALIDAHAINAAWPPYRFPEAADRRSRRRVLWHRHQTLNALIVAQLLARGFTVLAGGDLNDRRDDSAPWPRSLNLHGTGTDRLATSGDVEAGTLEVLSKAGSDHPRLRLPIKLYARVNDRPEVSQ